MLLQARLPNRQLHISCFKRCTMDFEKTITKKSRGLLKERSILISQREWCKRRHWRFKVSCKIE